MSNNDFQQLIWEIGRELYRPMPWREDTRPYYILVSEIMLQQTQVERVIPKFEAFIHRFPTVEALANASLAEVLRLWSGLGYNRRAKYLWEAAGMLWRDHEGSLPSSFEALVALPGVGPNTAGAVLAYGFNEPVVFIETNIRTVYFYHFFQDEQGVSDKRIRHCVEETLDKEHPREWYWALMDYGSYLKRQGASANDKSAHYKKQAPLKGSVREVRGRIVKELAALEMTEAHLRQVVGADERFPTALNGLLQDGIVMRSNDRIHLA